jgi:uncharacterized protein (DUF849 family)
MLLKAALNGNRTLQEHANIPVSPEQLAADTQVAVSRGIGAVHIHPRDKEGAESLQRRDIEPVVLAIRKRCPTVPIGISTGEWIEPNLSTRLKYVSEWEGLIDFASVNFSEAGAIEVSRKLLELNIGVEAGLFQADAAKILVESDLAEECLRLMFEPEDETVSRALETVHDIEKVLSLHQIKGKARLLHGFNSTVWPLLVEAKTRGYDTRIGFEDTLYLPDQQKAKNNADLIDAAKKLLTEET